MAELSEVRCYGCGNRIPEGQIARRNAAVRTGKDDEVRGVRRESFCPACASAFDAEALAEQRRRAKDKLYKRVGYFALIVIGLVVVALYVGVALLVRWSRNG